MLAHLYARWLGRLFIQDITIEHAGVLPLYEISAQDAAKSRTADIRTLRHTHRHPHVHTWGQAGKQTKMYARVHRPAYSKNKQHAHTCTDARMHSHARTHTHVNIHNIFTPHANPQIHTLANICKTFYRSSCHDRVTLKGYIALFYAPVVRYLSSVH